MSPDSPVHARDWTLAQYLGRLASDSPTPGGGSVAALVAALGAGLGPMVAAFTVGREKYAAVEQDMRAILAALEAGRQALLELVQADMDAYGGFRAAYSMPKDDPGRPQAIQEALRASLAVPVAVLEESLKIARLLPDLVEKGNPNLVSDAGCAAALLEGAALAAYMNVVVNLPSLSDKGFAGETQRRCENLLGKLRQLCSQVAEDTLARLKKA
ncbi:MAG: cyclodeaminase/cyclohydrolase family protein [Armatimonadetes bacterium]|nr:cyclodeaminase/cyclohydrolase family protein [Armatimonadota bacterium]